MIGMEKLTNKERVLKYIEDFGSISSLEAFRKPLVRESVHLGNTRLSASIWLLRHEDGLEIESINETKKNRYGEKTTYARYYLKGSLFEKNLVNKGVIKKESIFKKIFKGDK